jgi:hypothetical protein
MLDGGDDGSGGGGHQRPPVASRFQKGRSGNPNGRPKGSKNLATLIKEAAYDKIVVSRDGKKQRLSRIAAGLIQLSIKAAQGDTTAIQRLTDLVDEMEKRAAAARPPEIPLGKEDLEVLREVHARMRVCEAPDQPSPTVEA